MNNKKLLAILSIFLIISLPISLAQDNPFLFSQRAQDLGEAIVINVAGQEPLLVRQSLLEQQPAPVFAYLRGDTFTSFYNVEGATPATSKDIFTDISNIPPIKDIRIFPLEDTIKKIDGLPKYIKPKNSRYSLDNLGYVTFNIKQLELEKTDNKSGYNVPESIDLKFQAKILYDLEKGSLFGVSSQDLILPEVSEEEFDNLDQAKKQQYSFFNGRGYLRVVSLDASRARFAVYNKDLNLITAILPTQAKTEREQITTVTVSENSESSAMTLSYMANPFTDLFRIRVNKIISPQDKAIIKIYSGGVPKKTIAIKGTAIYPSSNWIVDGINDNSIDTSVTPQDIERFNKDPTRITDYNDLSVVLSTITIRNKVTGETKTLTSEQLRKKEGLFDYFTTPINDDEALALETRYCTPENTDSKDTIQVKIQDPGCAAVKNYKLIISDYPSKEYLAKSYYNIGKIFSDNLIETRDCISETFSESGCLVYKRAMKDLSNYYFQKVIDMGTDLSGDALNLLIEEENVKSTEYNLPDEFVTIKLIEVQEVKEEDKGSVKISVENQPAVTYRLNEILRDENNLPIKGYEDYNQNQYNAQNQFNIQSSSYNQGKYYYWVISNIESNSITLRRIYDEPNQNIWQNPSEIINWVVSKLQDYTRWGITTSIVKDTQSSLDYYLQPGIQVHKSIKISAIDTKKEVHVTILPGTGEAYSTSNFTINIGIDKRPFDFTPGQLKAQIDALNDIIDTLNKITSNLEEVVRVWKKTCLATFAFLTLKSSFFSGTAKNIARKDVASYYEQKCNREVAEDKFTSVDSCYFHYTDQINSAVDSNEQAIETVNDKLEGLTPDELAVSDKQFKQYREAGGTIIEYRDYLRYKALEGDNSEFGSYIKTQYSDNKFETKINQYQKAKTFVEENKVKIFNSSNVNQDLIDDTIKRVISSQRSPLATSLTKIEEISSIQVLDPNSRQATAYITDSAGKINLLQLQEITQLQYEVYNAGSVEIYIKNKERAAGQQQSITVNYQIALDKESLARVDNQKHIYIDKQYLTKEEVNLKPYIISSVLIGKDAQSLITEAIKPSEFKLYTSTLTTKNGGIKNTKYQGKSIIAQYDNNGLPLCYPAEDGNYVQVLEWYKTAQAKTFRVLNIGSDGIMDCGGGDDATVYTEYQLKLNENSGIHSKYAKIVDSARQCKNPEEVVGTINDLPITCSFTTAQASDLNNQPSCIDVMSPIDCRILYNACDPVMCPASRCNFGGKYPHIDNVITSGIIGSTMLCMPNFPEVAMPICLTGVLAGLKNIQALLEQYRGCLEANLKDGKNVGLCDYMRSVGICEIIWNEATLVLKARGGIINWIKEKITGEERGGGEYLTFQSSFDNIGNSFNFFTTEYSNTYLAAFKGKSTEEVGTQVCRMSVNGHFPNIGDILEKLSEPENPPQFMAWFDTAPYTTEAGNAFGTIPWASYSKPEEYDVYTVFYNIYAGNGYPNSQSLITGKTTPPIDVKDVSYVVYLTNSAGETLYVTTNPQTDGTIWGNIPTGKAVQQTIHTVAKKGLNQICVVINGKKTCGFGKVTSDMTMTLINDAVISDEMSREITSAEDCVPDYAQLSPSMGSLILPEQFGLLSSGITRTCAIDQPTPDINRWRKVGTCGKTVENVDLGSCWVDINTIDIKNVEKKDTLLQALKQEDLIKDPSQKFDLMSSDTSKAILSKLNTKRNEILAYLEGAFKSLSSILKTSVPTSQSMQSLTTPTESASTTYPTCYQQGFTISGLAGDSYVYKCLLSENKAQACDTSDNTVKSKTFDLDSTSSSITVQDINRKCKS